MMQCPTDECSPTSPTLDRDWAAGRPAGDGCRAVSRQAEGSAFRRQWTVHNAAAAKTWPAPKIEFRADGTGTWWSSNIRLNRIYSAYPLRWSTDRNRIIWRHEYGSLSDAVWGEFDRLLCRASNRNSIAPHEVLIDVVSVSHAEIEVDCPAINNSQPRCILRRVE